MGETRQQYTLSLTAEEYEAIIDMLEDLRDEREYREYATLSNLALLGIETVDADSIVDRLTSIGYTLADEPTDRFYTAELVHDGFTALIWQAYTTWCLSINRGNRVSLPYIRIGSPKIIIELTEIVAKHEAALMK